jgi:hypothetical protein
MSWLRVKIGCWLLGPLLREEMRLASHGRRDNPRQERYWLGRFTGALRVYNALATRDGHLATSQKGEPDGRA